MTFILIMLICNLKLKLKFIFETKYNFKSKMYLEKFFFSLLTKAVFKPQLTYRSFSFLIDKI